MADVEYKLEKLSTQNYSTWQTVLKSQLISKNLWEYVVASKNNTEEEEVKNELAKHLMYVSMDASQIAATGVCDSAYDLWKKIKENHEGAEENLQSSALADFPSLRYRKNENLVSYSGRYELTLGKLNSTGHKVDEKTKLWVFSNSLPMEMKMTVNMFTMAKPTGKVSELISQLKINHHLSNTEGMDDTAFYVDKRPSSDKQTKVNDIETKEQATNKDPKVIICTYCKNKGHLWKDCRKLKANND